MSDWLARGVGTLGIMVGGVLVVSMVGIAGWRRATARAVERLTSASAATDAGAPQARVVGDLPDPVARYFAHTLAPGQPPVRTARIEHRGEFRTALAAPWEPFTSVQHVSTRPRGFVWDARIRMGPLLAVRVRDSYLSGRAVMEGRVAGLVPVVSQAGAAEIASGALHRWLAEAAWYPTALLPKEGVVWEGIDDSTALATLSDSGITVSLEVGFDRDGDLVRVAGSRFRDEEGGAVLRPWEGHFRNHITVHGMRIPAEGEVAWVLPEGRMTYWRGRITTVEYELDR